LPETVVTHIGQFYFFPISFMWQHWVNGILGLLVVVLPFLGLDAVTMTWTLAVTGIVIAILGFWGAGELSSHKLAH
jgi:hypothetical protein